MKINKSKSPFISGGAPDAPDEKDIAKAVKGEKFADALSALVSNQPAQSGAPDSTRAFLAKIALQSDLTDEGDVAAALRQSAEVLVKSRLSDKFKHSELSEKIIGELSDFVSEDPLLKAKLLSVLKNLRDGGI
jgi:hypothetical protein